MSDILRREMVLDHARFVDLAALRRFVADACAAGRVADDLRDALELAVDEACTNVIEHGYAPDRPGVLSVVVECDDAQVRVSVADRGTPFRPEQAAAADTRSGWQRRVAGGLGLHLIRSVVDALAYDAGADGTNCLTLVVHRHSARQGGSS